MEHTRKYTAVELDQDGARILVCILQGFGVRVGS